MKTNAAGIALIQHFEQCRLNAYLCPAGVPTIGWGHTGDVKLGQTITQHQADVIFAFDLERFEGAVSALAPNANENEFAALVSFAYNCGYGPHGLGGSSLLRYFLQGSKLAAAQEFGHWCHGGGVVLPGLVTRREMEKALFLTPPVGCYCGDPTCEAVHT